MPELLRCDLCQLKGLPADAVRDVRGYRVCSGCVDAVIDSECEINLGHQPGVVEAAVRVVATCAVIAAVLGAALSGCEQMPPRPGPVDPAPSSGLSQMAEVAIREEARMLADLYESISETDEAAFAEAIGKRSGDAARAARAGYLREFHSASHPNGIWDSAAAARAARLIGSGFRRAAQ